MRRVTLVTHPRDNDLEELFVSILQHVAAGHIIKRVVRAKVLQVSLTLLFGGHLIHRLFILGFKETDARNILP